jgi:hypothetical protein
MNNFPESIQHMPKVMFGTIRSPNYYRDGKESFEIWLSDTSDILFKNGQRTELVLGINGEQYICGIRYTERNGAWMSPDLKMFNSPNTKVRLSNVLKLHGHRKNEKVKLLLNLLSKHVTIVKAE